MQTAAYSMSFLVVLFCTVTLCADASMAGEVIGKAYGFPFLWHARGASSLSRVVLVPSLIVGLVVYGMASHALAKALTVALKALAVPPAVGHVVGMALVILALITLAIFLTNFLSIQPTFSSESLGDEFSSRTLHLGAIYQ